MSFTAWARYALFPIAEDPLSVSTLARTSARTRASQSAELPVCSRLPVTVPVHTAGFTSTVRDPAAEHPAALHARAVSVCVPTARPRPFGVPDHEVAVPRFTPANS